MVGQIFNSLFGGLRQVKDAEKIDSPVTGFGSPQPRGLFSTGDEYLPRLFGREKFLKWRQMPKSNGMIAAIQRAYTLPILQAEWSLEGGDDAVREFVEPMIMTGWKGHLRQALRFPQYGMYPFEQTFEIKGGKTHETSCAPRPPWTIYSMIEDPATRALVAITQLCETTQGYIPADRLVMYVFDPDGENYMGNSIYRPCLMHFDMVTEFYKIDAIGNNRHAVGTLFLEASRQMVDEDFSTLKTWASSFQTSATAALVVREGDIKAREVIFSKYENTPILDSIRHHNRMMAISACASFLSIGEESAGSYARSESEVNFFLDALHAIADIIVEVESNQRIKRIVDLNFDDVNEYPMMRYTGIKRTGLEAMGAFLQQIAPLLTDNTPVENLIREKLGIPPLTKQVAVVDDIEPDATPEDGRESTETEDDTGEETLESAELSAVAQVTASGFWRDRRPEENFIRLKAIESHMDDRKESVENALKDIRAAQVEQLVNEARGMITRKEFAGLATLRPRKQEQYRQTMMRDFWRDWDGGYSEVVTELKRQVAGEPVVEEIEEERQALAATIEPTDEQLKSEPVKRKRAKQTPVVNGKAQDYSEDIAVTVVRDFRNAARDAMLDDSLDTDEVINRASTAGNNAGNRAISSGASYVATTPVQLGRDAAGEMNADAIERGYYSAILDSACSVCAAADGTPLDINDPKPMTPNPQCEGTADKCRCIHVWVAKSEVTVQ